MKLEDVNQSIKRYFDKKTPEEIIKIFEEMGVQFEDIDDTREKPALNIASVGSSLPNKTNGQRLSELKRYFAAKDSKQLPHYTEYHCKKAHINRMLYK